MTRNKNIAPVRILFVVVVEVFPNHVVATDFSSNFSNTKFKLVKLALQGGVLSSNLQILQPKQKKINHLGRYFIKFGQRNFSHELREKLIFVLFQRLKMHKFHKFS